MIEPLKKQQASINFDMCMLLSKVYEVSHELFQPLPTFLCSCIKFIKENRLKLNFI